MFRRWPPRVRAPIRDALTYGASHPILAGLYATLLVALLLWWALGLLTLFVGVFGLLAQGFVLLVLVQTAFVAVVAAYHDPTRRAFEALARDGADAYCELWIDVSEGPGQNAPVVSGGQGFVYLPPGVPPSIWGSRVGAGRVGLPPGRHFGTLEDDSEPPHADEIRRRGRLDTGGPDCR